MSSRYDAVVVGAGPNGLVAAVTLARAGRRVLVVEARDTIGGACSSAELTLPGFIHDVGAAIHPLGAASRMLGALPLSDFGLRFVQPLVPVAHPLDGGRAVVLHRGVEDTAAQLGQDGGAYRRLYTSLVRDALGLVDGVLDPLRAPLHPLAFARLGLAGAWPALPFARRWFSGERARALFAGCAAHAIQPLSDPLTAGFGLLLGVLGHAFGWPAVAGGSQRLPDALAAHLGELGGEIVTGRRVDTVDELPPAPAYLLDTPPRELLRLAGHRLPPRYRRRLARFRHGPGVHKLDWALDGPIPWVAPEVAQAGTVHLGGTLAEIAAGEEEVGRGRHPARPFVLLAQQSVFDPSRAPQDHHTAWAYCHVPNGSDVDMTDAIERQVERFAPGFRDRILARAVAGPAALERRNANLVGGDINGGSADWRQLVARPALRLVPAATPDRALYLCSASTPPGGGVHGACGHLAAHAALRRADWG